MKASGNSFYCHAVYKLKMHISLPITLFPADAVLDDFLVAENSPFQPDINSPTLTSERASTITSPRLNHSNLNSFGTSTPDGGPEIPLSGGIRSQSSPCISCHVTLFLYKLMDVFSAVAAWTEIPWRN
jgi:hypothetical protein